MVSFQEPVNTKGHSVIHGYLRVIRRHAVPPISRVKNLDVIADHLLEDQEHV